MTGAAGQIAYSLLFSIAKGDVFGKEQVQKSFVSLAHLTHTLSLYLIRHCGRLPQDLNSLHGFSSLKYILVYIFEGLRTDVLISGSRLHAVYGVQQYFLVVEE